VGIAKSSAQTDNPMQGEAGSSLPWINLKLRCIRKILSLIVSHLPDACARSTQSARSITIFGTRQRPHDGGPAHDAKQLVQVTPAIARIRSLLQPSPKGHSSKNRLKYFVWVLAPALGTGTRARAGKLVGQYAPSSLRWSLVSTGSKDALSARMNLCPPKQRLP
jgi:hypothetical protein